MNSKLVTCIFNTPWREEVSKLHLLTIYILVFHEVLD